jgi:DNA-binding NarL/FixJ family response regulator
MITLSRPWGDRRLGLREARFVRLFHAELGRLWGPTRDPLNGLGVRERQVLHHLRNGDSEKQVAAKMHISPHTVHDYAKRVHRHFDVASRGELLAKVNRMRPDFRPRLAVESFQEGG